jgi:hypothetical protein
MDRRLTRTFITAALAACLCQCASAQEAQGAAAAGQDADSKEAQAHESKGLPPRATPGDYRAQIKVGALTLAGEFKAHALPTMEALLNTEDFVVVEVGVFGPAGTRVKLSKDDFALRINGTRANAKKPPLAAAPFAFVFSSLKDPAWEPTKKEKAESKGKTTIGGGGGGGDDPPPSPEKMPFNLVREMQQRVQRAILPEGERELPVAGLLFFQYGGKSVRSAELIYNGPAGKVTLDLNP